MVREGLVRLEGVVSVSESPDARLGICDMQTRDGHLLSPIALAEELTAARVGARLRAVEVTLDGRLEKKVAMYSCAYDGSSSLSTWIQ